MNFRPAPDHPTHHFHGTEEGVLCHDPRLARFEIDEATGCHLWLGATSDEGYAQMHVAGHTVYVHRLVYELVIGPIPEGHQIDHVAERGCRHRHCINPEHLEAVTQRENILRGGSLSAQRARQTHCARGHEFTPENTYERPDRPGRNCHECRRANQRERYRARTAAR